ncbi:MAG TPA: glycerate kinase, partial [Oscillibacter sp.]|nr:glycerate kinase [Oscillibacter sp.]
MSKYILIPDSFKGSLSSGEICGILGREIRTLEPEAEICSIPVADGGEGTVDAFLAALGGEKIPVSCRDPYGRAITACYGLLPDGGTAVVEMAAAAGLPLVGDDRRAADATTYGVGQLM